MKMNVRGLIYGMSIVACLSMSSCDNGGGVSDGGYKQFLDEVAAIDAYLATAGIIPIKDPSGIRMVIDKLGTELPPDTSNTVDVDYIGRRFVDQVIFDQGNTKLKLSRYIEGWQVGLSKLPAGSEATLYIPSSLGYGPAGSGPIPGNTTLEFDVKLNKVVYSSAELQRLGSDSVAIDAYLEGKPIDAIKDGSGLRYIITQPGSGPIPTWFDKVKFKAIYKLLSNDANNVAQVDYAPSDSNYNRVIDQIPDGLKIGLQKLNVGGKATFYIPSGLAFGTPGATNGGAVIIPPNSNIIVDVELTEIVSP